MLGTENRLSDVTIHWPKQSRRIEKIIRTGRCPSFAKPRKAKRRAMVALVDSTGRVQLLFRLSRIEERVSVIGADGRKYSNGCILVAEKGTLRRPKLRDPRKLSVNRHAIGAIGYFDFREQEGVYYSLTGTMPSKMQGFFASPRRVPYHRHPFFSKNIGKSLSQHERALIMAYVRWIGNEDIFEHHYLPGPRLYTDLFYRPGWVLIEAKIRITREVIRTALGQIMDYQRYYLRHPRLAILFSRRPENSMIELLTSKRVATIWQSRGASFADSVDGELTTQIRNVWL